MKKLIHFLIKKSVFSTDNNIDADEFVKADVILYFQDINEQWVTKNTVGTILVDKFDLKDIKTFEFIAKLRSGETVEQKIDG